MKYLLLAICILEVYYVVDLSFSEGLRNNIICVIFETGATSAFCRNFFEENSFVLSKAMIFRSVFLPLLLVVVALAVSVYFYLKGKVKKAVQMNVSLFITAFFLFSLLVLGF